MEEAKAIDTTTIEKTVLAYLDKNNEIKNTEEYQTVSEI